MNKPRPKEIPPPPPPSTLLHQTSWKKPKKHKTPEAQHLHQRQLSLQGYPSASQSTQPDNIPSNLPRRNSTRNFANKGVSGLMKRASISIKKDNNELLSQLLSNLKLKDMPDPIQSNDPFVIRVMTVFFKETDVDQSGGISPAELNTGLRSIGKKLGERFQYKNAISLFQSLDLDHSGKIELPELIEGLAQINDRRFLMICAAVEIVSRFFPTGQQSSNSSTIIKPLLTVNVDTKPQSNESNESNETNETNESNEYNQSNETNESNESTALNATSTAPSSSTNIATTPIVKNPKKPSPSKWSLLKRSSTGDGSIVISQEGQEEKRVSIHERSVKNKGGAWGKLAQTLKNQGVLSNGMMAPGKSLRRNASQAARSGSTHSSNSNSRARSQRKRLASFKRNEGMWVSNSDVKHETMAESYSDTSGTDGNTDQDSDSGSLYNNSPNRSRSNTPRNR